MGRRTSRTVVVVMTVCHVLRRLILCKFFVALFITLDGRYDRSSHAQWSIEGLRSIKLKLLEFWYWDYFSDHHDEPARWTFMATTVRHALRNPTLGKNCPSSFSSFTTMPPTDRHRNEGSSQAP
ncbi:hypothetical protein EJD97_023054 [Solanum chilense]|uniref:Uncharacterized protein n=1 Tax=Solanum chilense TaxID=4083 RepID=A0A6N2C462_SOLCI|nr:hypothetical protein EJD97_023054 [Solanum chilense]